MAPWVRIAQPPWKKSTAVPSYGRKSLGQQRYQVCQGCGWWAWENRGLDKCKGCGIAWGGAASCGRHHVGATKAQASPPEGLAILSKEQRTFLDAVLGQAGTQLGVDLEAVLGLSQQAKAPDAAFATVQKAQQLLAKADKVLVKAVAEVERLQGCLDKAKAFRDEAQKAVDEAKKDAEAVTDIWRKEANFTKKEDDESKDDAAQAPFEEEVEFADEELANTYKELVQKEKDLQGMRLLLVAASKRTSSQEPKRRCTGTTDSEGSAAALVARQAPAYLKQVEVILAKANEHAEKVAGETLRAGMDVS